MHNIPVNYCMPYISLLCLRSLNMPNAFKYMERKWAKPLLSMGLIRIGTLYDFRKQEHGKGISDQDEGTKNISHRVNAKSAKQIESFEKNFFEGSKIGDLINKGVNIIFNENEFINQYNSQDLYIYCLSSKFSKKTMESFERADTCLWLTKPDLFLKIITNEMNSITPTRFRGIHKAIYSTRNESWNGEHGYHPSLIKEPKDSIQYEIRAIWEPMNNLKPIKPQIIMHHKIGSAFTEIKNI